MTRQGPLKGAVPGEDESLPVLMGVATGTPDGGVAVIRLSGAQSVRIAAVVAGTLGPARRLVRRRLSTGEDALVVVMPGPASFTGEDVVEFHVHGGEVNVRQVRNALLEAGAEAAGPGDFSRRAFMHGKLTLDEAEGIAAIIGAQSEAALAQARRLAAGEVGKATQKVATAVAELRMEIEAHLDFEEDVGDEASAWRARVQRAAQQTQRWLEGFEAGRRVRERPRVVLAGPPNAGKSALVNALLGHERLLVSARAGTTRDYVEVEQDFGGVRAWVVDTAGLRGETPDELEAEGMERARDQVAGADLVLWVEGADQPASGRRLESDWIAVENKRDLGQRRPRWFGVSASTGEGVEQLRGEIGGRLGGGEGAWIGLARHRARVDEAHAALLEANELLAQGAGLELIAFPLGVAQRRLEEITGRHALGAMGEDVLHAIFSRFCIGK